MQYGIKVSIATDNYKLLQAIISYFGVVIADKNQTRLLIQFVRFKRGKFYDNVN